MTIHPEMQELVNMGIVKLSLEHVDGKGFTLMTSLTQRGESIAKEMEGDIDEKELESFLQAVEDDWNSIREW